METIPTGCKGAFQSLDRLREPKVFQGTPQTKWTTSSMISQAPRLRFHVETYTWKDKYESGHPIKKESS